MEMGLKQAKKIVIDLGLVIECKEEELLPERLLCAWRMCRPDLTQTVNIDLCVCWKQRNGVAMTSGCEGELPMMVTLLLKCSKQVNMSERRKICG